MRVAVVLSGAFVSRHPLGDIKHSNLRQRQLFTGADFYYSTWNSFQSQFEETFPNYDCSYFEEPTPKYHPYQMEHIASPYYEETRQFILRQPNRMEWARHHTKQHLAYALMLDKIDLSCYDVVIRARYDNWFHKDADFTPYVEDCFENKRAIGFAVTIKEKFDTVYESNFSKTPKHKNWMLDQLIIHRADMVDTSHIYSLYENKKLHAAEMGWWQILSEPWGNNHRNIHGMVNHDKNVLDRFMIR